MAENNNQNNNQAQAQPVDLNQLLKVRREKLAALQEALAHPSGEKQFPDCRARSRESWRQ